MRVQNAEVFDVDVAARYEDGLPAAEILASTFGGDVAAAFIDGGGDPPVDLVVEEEPLQLRPVARRHAHVGVQR